MGNAGSSQPWRNPEDSLLVSRFDPDFRPATQVQKLDDHSPLRQADPILSEADEELLSQARVNSMDCVMDTVDFIKWPIFLGVGWGAVQASVHAKPNIRQVRRSVGSGWALAFNGLMQEFKYLKKPTLLLGGFAALYSLSSCAVAKIRHEDGVWNSAAAGAITGLGLGMYKRCTNLMAIYSVFGALVGGLSKWHQLDPWAGRSRLTYYELVESRRRMMSPAFREEAKDGYFHQYLDPKLRDMGIKVPDSWQQQQQQ